MIIASQLILVSPQSSRNYVIEDHTFDDGKVVRVEGLREATEDHEQAMLARVPQLEAQREAKDAEERTETLRTSADEKLAEYIKSLPESELKTIGLSDDEVAVVKEQPLVKEPVITK